MSDSNMQTTVIMNDLQIPFQEQRVVDMVVGFTNDLHPDRIILAGDVADCYTISDFDKDPLTKKTLRDEITEVGLLMDSLADIPEKVFIGGNHEDRIRRFVWRHAPQLGEIAELDFPQLFHLDDYGFKWLPYGEIYTLGKLLVTHGDIVRQHSGYTARAHLDKFGKSVLVGHTHRLGAYYRTQLGKPYVAYENGCLCSLTPEYIKNPNWQHGFAVVRHDPVTREFSVQQIPIFRRGKKYVFYFGQTEVVA